MFGILYAQHTIEGLIKSQHTYISLINTICVKVKRRGTYAKVSKIQTHRQLDGRIRRRQKRQLALSLLWKNIQSEQNAIKALRGWT